MGNESGVLEWRRDVVTMSCGETYWPIVSAGQGAEEGTELRQHESTEKGTELRQHKSRCRNKIFGRKMPRYKHFNLLPKMTVTQIA